MDGLQLTSATLSFTSVFLREILNKFYVSSSLKLFKKIILNILSQIANFALTNKRQRFSNFPNLYY